MTSNNPVVQNARIESRILLIRGQRVLIDADLAELYGVATKRLNEQVKRNKDRFPADFMFILTADERTEVVANCDHLAKLKFSSKKPAAFTEHGAIMAAIGTTQAADRIRPPEIASGGRSSPPASRNFRSRAKSGFRCAAAGAAWSRPACRTAGSTPR